MWYGHVTRRDDEWVELGKVVMRLECGREEKERKTKSEVDGQRECGLVEGEGTARGRICKTGLCGGNLSETSK